MTVKVELASTIMQSEDIQLSPGEGKICWRAESSVERFAYL